MADTARHNYEYDVILDGPTAPARVVRMVGENKRVLEIGPGPGSITKHLQGAKNCRVTGVELDEDALKILEPFCEKTYQANLNDPDWPAILPSNEKFEVVVAADVLEHLYDPWTTLKLMRGFLQENGYIVTSLPHVGHNAIIGCLLSENFEYRDWGLLDRTHIRFFGMKNIESLFADAGLKIVDAEFVITAPEDTEFSESWRSLDPSVRNALSTNRFGSVYQIVVKAIPENADGNPIKLTELEATATVAAKFPTGPRSIARAILSDKARVKLSSLLSVLGYNRRPNSGA